MIDSILRLSKLLAVLALAGSLAACGDDDDDNGGNGGGDNRVVTMTGVATVFPVAVQVLTQAGITWDVGDLSDLEVTLRSAVAELNPANTTVLGNSPQPLTPASGNSATFSVANVNVDQIGIAVIAHLDPAEGTEPVQSHRVTTGILSVADIPTGDLDETFATGGSAAGGAPGAPAFILPAEFEAVLATATGNTLETMIEDGYILAFVTNGTAPIPGATITLEATGEGDVTDEYTIRYPTFTGGPGAETGATGLAVITGPERAAPLTITATVDTTTYTAQGGVKPGVAFIAPATP